MRNSLTRNYMIELKDTFKLMTLGHVYVHVVLVAFVNMSQRMGVHLYSMKRLHSVAYLTYTNTQHNSTKTERYES